MDRRLLVALLLLATPLAGCIGGDKDGEGDPGASENVSAASLPEGRGPILAFEETNATEEGVGGLDHDHDLWQGRERVPLLETRVTFGFGALEEYVETTEPELGALVFEATSAVEVVATAPQREDFADPVGTAAPTLLYKHAAASEWIEVGRMAWDVPTSIAITHPSQTDMPHATYSLWAFQVRTSDPGASALSFTLRADILRGPEEIPMWPGHPAFYTDSHTRTVLDVEAAAGENGITGDFAPIGVPEGAGPVAAERVISYGTRTLSVFVNISDFQVANPIDTPTNFYLRFTNASGDWNLTDPFDFDGEHPADAREHVWTLRVDDAGMDSPYADGSRWNFELGAAFARNTPALSVTCYRNCATWSADYHLTVVASDEALPDESYD